LVQLGDRSLVGCKLEMTRSTFRCLALEMIFEATNICVNPAHHLCVSLIMTNGPGTHTPSPPEIHHVFPLLFSLALGPTMAEIWPSSLLCSSPLCWFDFLQQNSTENGKRVKRRRKFINFIPLESSRRGERDRVIFI
jgi:hypothetical protein